MKRYSSETYYLGQTGDEPPKGNIPPSRDAYTEITGGRVPVDEDVNPSGERESVRKHVDIDEVPGSMSPEDFLSLREDLGPTDFDPTHPSNFEAPAAAQRRARERAKALGELGYSRSAQKRAARVSTPDLESHEQIRRLEGVLGNDLEGTLGERVLTKSPREYPGHWERKARGLEGEITKFETIIAQLDEQIKSLSAEAFVSGKTLSLDQLTSLRKRIRFLEEIKGRYKEKLEKTRKEGSKLEDRKKHLRVIAGRKEGGGSPVKTIPGYGAEEVEDWEKLPTRKEERGLKVFRRAEDIEPRVPRGKGEDVKPWRKKRHSAGKEIDSVVMDSSRTEEENEAMRPEFFQDFFNSGVAVVEGETLYPGLYEEVKGEGLSEVDRYRLGEKQLRDRETVETRLKNFKEACKNNPRLSDLVRDCAKSIYDFFKEHHSQIPQGFSEYGYHSPEEVVIKYLRYVFSAGLDGLNFEKFIAESKNQKEKQGRIEYLDESARSYLADVLSKGFVIADRLLPEEGELQRDWYYFVLDTNRKYLENTYKLSLNYKEKAA